MREENFAKIYYGFAYKNKPNLELLEWPKKNKQNCL